MPDGALDLIKMNIAIHDPGIVSLGEHRTGGSYVKIVGNFAHNLHGQVFHGEYTRKAAILVDDAGEVGTRFNKTLQGIAEGHQRWQYGGRPHHSGSGFASTSGLQACEHVDEVHHPHGDILIVDHRVATMVARHEYPQLVDSRIRLDPVDLCTGHHGVLHIPLGKIEHTVHHE